MAVELNRLVKKVSKMDLRLISGERGLNNMVTWVHMIETKESSNFLEGGEIAFSTGIGLCSGLTLLDLVTCVYENKAAGMVINLGPFIETIPQQIIDFGAEHDFPIFTIPWKIHLAEIMRIFSFTITKSEQKALEAAAAFKHAILFPDKEEMYLVPLSENGFSMNWNFCVVILNIGGIKENKISRLEDLRISYENVLYHKFNDFTLFTLEEELVLVLGNYSEQKTHDIVNELKYYESYFLKEDELLTVGIGKHTKSVRCIYKSYKQASSIQRLQKKGNLDPDMIYYEELGIYTLLMSIDDQEILSDYYNQHLMPLALYDSQNKSNLIFVLKTYLDLNGSVKETSEKLFVHRNTVNYKLKKIEEILNIDLSDLNVRLQLDICFMLQKIL